MVSDDLNMLIYPTGSFGSSGITIYDPQYEIWFWLGYKEQLLKDIFENLNL
jgi:hypothetical protein